MDKSFIMPYENRGLYGKRKISGIRFKKCIYVERSTDETARQAGDETINRLHERVKKLKKDRELEEKYMLFEELLKSEEARGFAEGEARGREMYLIDKVANKLKKGKSAAQIAEELEEDLGLIQRVCDAAEKCGSESDTGVIYEVYQNEFYTVN